MFMAEIAPNTAVAVAVPPSPARPEALERQEPPGALPGEPRSAPGVGQEQLQPPEQGPQQEPERKPRREGIVRISLKAHRKSTSVSMDVLLYRILVSKMGGDKAVQSWAQRVATEVETLEANGIVMAPRDVKASLSRLIQRQALRTLWGSEI